MCLGRLASYNLVKRKESVPCVVLATCKVAGPSTSISKKVDRTPYYLSGLSGVKKIVSYTEVFVM